MRRLILLRHAKTEKLSASGLDRDRRLDERGRSDAPIMGQYLANEGLTPDLALISPAARVRETWDLLAGALPSAPRMDVVPELYAADPTQLLRIVRTADGREPNVLMVVAHNPGLHEFALTLTKTGRPSDRADLGDSLPTCGLAVLDFPVDDWHAIAFQTATLERFVNPRRLRGQSG